MSMMSLDIDGLSIGLMSVASIEPEETAPVPEPEPAYAGSNGSTKASKRF